MSVPAEALLISALINSQAVGEEVGYGISPTVFEGYQAEYNWLTNYVSTYGCQPTPETLQVQVRWLPAGRPRMTSVRQRTWCTPRRTGAG